MKRNTIILLIGWLGLVGCTIQREVVIPQTGTTPGTTTPGTTLPGSTSELKVHTVTGEWVAANGGSGGLYAFNTFKNYQYTLTVANNNQKLDITLTSADIDVQFALYDPLGQLIQSTTPSRSAVNSFTVNAGAYRVVVGAARQAVGKFTLTAAGVNSDPARIASQTLQSGLQNWGALGGGGNVKSTKNHFYSFEVTDDNSTIDLEIESADTETSLILYDGLDVAVARQSGQRYLFQIQAAKKGTYTIMAGTGVRGSVGSYKLRVFGKVGNLKQIPSTTSTITGNWPSGTSFDTYSLQLTDNSSPLDIDLASADISVRVTLQNSTGDKLDNTCCADKSVTLTFENLSKGTYRIMVQSYPTPSRQGPGNYTLNVFGRYTDFKKL